MATATAPVCAAALRALRSLLRSPSFSSTEQASFGSSVSESSSSGAEGRATQFVRRSTGEKAGWLLASPMNCRSEEMVLQIWEEKQCVHRSDVNSELLEGVDKQHGKDNAGC